MTSLKNLIASGLILAGGVAAMACAPNGGNHGSNNHSSPSVNGGHSPQGGIVTAQMVACNTYSPVQIKQIKTSLHNSKLTLAQALEIGQHQWNNGQFIECELVTTGNKPAYEFETFVNETVNFGSICGVEGKLVNTTTPTLTAQQKTELTTWKTANHNAKVTAAQALTTATKQFNDALPFDISLTLNNSTPVWKIEFFRDDSVWTAWVDAVDGKVITPSGNVHQG